MSSLLCGNGFQCLSTARISKGCVLQSGHALRVGTPGPGGRGVVGVGGDRLGTSPGRVWQAPAFLDRSLCVMTGLCCVCSEWGQALSSESRSPVRRRVGPTRVGPTLQNYQLCCRHQPPVTQKFLCSEWEGLGDSPALGSSMWPSPTAVICPRGPGASVCPCLAAHVGSPEAPRPEEQPPSLAGSVLHVDVLGKR